MGGKTTTSTNKVTIPKEVLDRYNAVNAQAANVAQNPFQKYGTTQEDFVAQFNEQQLKGIQGINDVAGMGATYENVDKYLNPYIKNVADTTRAQIEQANEQAQSGALGTAIQSDAFGGDRAGVAAANLAGQQNLAMGSTMANIFGQGYDQAVSTSMADANRLLGVAGAQLGAGTQMQQTEQAGLDALINQFQQEKGYPFQVAQFLANIAMGTGALSGSTTTSTQMAPFFSDRRLKHDIKKIGEADNGLPIYTFKYKGDENQQTHVGFMADEVEKKNPDAVGLDPSGYKTVDYDKAAQSMGGGVNAGRSGEGFAEGGVAGPYGSKVGQGVGVGSYVPQAYLPVGELMMADPDVSTAHQQNALDTLNSMASAGKSVAEIRDLLNKNARGGVVGGYADGGGVQPQVHNDYLSSTLAAQATNKDKPELKVAQPSEAPESPFSQILKLVTTVIPMMNAGGVAGRHGYALDGTVEERIRDAMRATAANENSMRLTRDEVPAVQTLGSLPDAGVVAAEAAPSAEEESARAYRAAAANRFNGLAPAADDVRPMARPTGLIPVDTAPTVEQRPLPRPTGLGPAAVVQPMARPEGLEAFATGYGAARNHFRTKIIPQESGNRQFDENGQPLTSPKGATGIAQVMKATGPEAADLANLAWDEDRWKYDADYNAAIGEAYFLDQYRKFGSIDKASAAYNAGPGALQEAMSKAEAFGGSYLDYLPAETQNYVKSTTGISGGAGSNGLAGGAGGDTLGTQEGGVKPYDERNTLGKMVYDRDGKVNRDAMLSLFAGLGDMLTSPSPFLLPSIGAGISGAARTYMAREEQVADIQEKRLAALAKATKDVSIYNEKFGTNLTAEEYLRLALDINKPPPEGVRGTGSNTENSFMGVPVNVYGANLNDLIPLGDGTFIRAGDSLQYNERLLAEQNYALSIGVIEDPQVVAQTADLIKKLKEGNGTIAALNEDGSPKVDENGRAVYTTDSTIARMAQAKVEFDVGSQLKSTASEQIAKNIAATTAVNNMVDTFVAAGDRQGILAPIRELISGLSNEAGIGEGNFRALSNEVEKARSSFIDQYSTTSDTDFGRELVLNGLPALSKEAAANAYVLATMQAHFDREAAILDAISKASTPPEAYKANESVSTTFPMEETIDKYYKENLSRMNVADPTAEPENAPIGPAPQWFLDGLPDQGPNTQADWEALSEADRLPFTQNAP